MTNATMSSLSYPELDGTGLSQSDFGQGPTGTMPPPPIPGFMTSSPTSGSWTDASVSATGSQHRHSLSGGSLGALSRPSLNLTGSTSLPYVPTTGPYISPTRATHTQPSNPMPLPPISATATGHPTLRTQRSGSFSHANPFAFNVPVGVPDIAPPPPPIPEAMRSRPSTAGVHNGTRPSSPEYDYDEGDQSDSPPGYWSSSPPRDDHTKSESGDPGMEGVQSTSRPRTAGRRPSRTSPEGGGYVTHTNEVPQEYRPAVERIFFEFLNNTCSNCKSLIYSGLRRNCIYIEVPSLSPSPSLSA